MSEPAMRSADADACAGWSPAARFAVYYAPPAGSAWWRAGCAWLGRDAASGAACAQPQPEGLARPLAELTGAPRRYGWHGTLVPPFRLADGVDAPATLAAARRWAVAQAAFALPVAAAQLGDFVALRPANDEGAARLRELAAAALRALAPLRAAPGEAERARRLASPLTPRQRELLLEWGYPYVLDEFRFHLTLSDALPEPAEREALLAWWRPELARLGPLPVDGAALFVEPAPGEPFVLWQRLPFGPFESLEPSDGASPAMGARA